MVLRLLSTSRWLEQQPCAVILATEEHKDELLRRVEIADDLNWCHLADGHYPKQADECLLVLLMMAEVCRAPGTYKRQRKTAGLPVLTPKKPRSVMPSCVSYTLKGALRAGLSPLELAGADFHGIPWMQLVNLVLSGWSYLEGHLW
jgi:hypothetical protein